MPANTQSSAALSLGGFLRDRRERLAPEPGAQSRRRTPGLRREEVATRAGVSVTWYTWLEQGRGGPPSDEVLERLSRALELDGDGREVLFLLAQQRPPPVTATPPSPVPAAVQRVLDAMGTSPAIVKTTSWDVVAWNAAAVALFGDYGAAPARERNILRRMFTDTSPRNELLDWEDNARLVIAVFRIDVARAGGCSEAAALVAELQSTSADFRRLWAENEMRSHGVALKHFVRPGVGPLTLEISSFTVDGAEGLSMMVFTPAAAADVRVVQMLLSAQAA